MILAEITRIDKKTLQQVVGVTSTTFEAIETDNGMFALLVHISNESVRILYTQRNKMRLFHLSSVMTFLNSINVIHFSVLMLDSKKITDLPRKYKEAV